MAEEQKFTELKRALDDQILLVDFGLSFALCNSTFAGTREGIVKVQELFAKVKALVDELTPE